jgi:hypothetical protein
VFLNEHKTQALKEFKIPNNASELHRFLGIILYASCWIKNLAAISEPLWNLTRSDVRWEWTEEYIYLRLFDLIKQSLINAVGYFDLNWQTFVTVDASPVELSAVLTQQHPKDKDKTKLILCIIRMLTDTEKRYSQIEQEALAPVWAAERRHMYLLGRHFWLRIDKKAIALIKTRYQSHQHVFNVGNLDYHHTISQSNTYQN